MSNKKLTIRRGDALFFLVSFLIAVVVFFNDTHEFNKLYGILPFVFGLCYVLILAPLRIRTGSKTVLWFAVAEFLRLVFVPCYAATSKYIGFYGFSTEEISLLARSVLLMSYECVFISLFLLFALRNNIKETQEELEVMPLGNDAVALMIVFLLGVILYFAVPAVHKTLNFLLLDSNSAKIRALTTGSQSSTSVGLITFSYDAFLCGFIIVLDYAKRKYDISEKRQYVILAAIVGLLTVSIINGESRSTLVYSLYAITGSLCVCFKKYRKRITRILLIGGGAVLLGMTAYRLFAVYRYSSYRAAIRSGSLRENYIAAFIEMYCLGPQSVACGIHFSDLMRGDFTIGTFLYDIFRPFMGLNFIAKLFDGRTSIMMYNSWFSGIEGKSNGLFLQISNQGYCYFGLLLAPVFACIFMRIAIFIEKKLKQTKTLFLFFFYNYVYIRVATCVIAGTMSGYISTITMALIMCGSIYLLQKFFSSTTSRRGVNIYRHSS